MDMFCKLLDLPDLTSRHGLKKVHRNFERIQRRLDRLYEKNSENYKIVGGVIIIWSKMCADSILRDKLFNAGFLSRLLPLLDMPECRHLALRALSSVTPHGSINSQTKIAQQTPVLIQLITAHPDDHLLAELSISTMSHAIGALVGNSADGHPNSEVLKDLNLLDVLKVFVTTARKPEASSDLIHRVLLFIAGSTETLHLECKAHTPVLSLLVAGLRSRNTTIRSTCLCGIIQLYHYNAEADNWFYDQKKALDATRRGWPDHLVDIIKDYGMKRIDVATTLIALNGNRKAFMQCAQDRDLYKLGKTLVPYILNTEFSVVQGIFQAQNERTGTLETMDVGLPFTKWDDALPHCAKAIRERSDPSEVDAADILDIKYLIIKGDIKGAMAHADKAIARNPKQPYFYYALTLRTISFEGLRDAKKGLNCPKITPFVRCGLLQRAVDHAGDLGIASLQTAPSSDSELWEEGMLLLTSAMKDAQLYMNEAPPGSRHMRKILYWYTLLSMALRGPEISPDLSELQDALLKYKFADDFANFVDNAPANTKLRQAYLLVVGMYPDAAGEWADVIHRLDSKEPGASKEPNEDDLATWLNNPDGESDKEDGPHSLFCGAASTNDHIELYKCSYCGNMSAALQKCGGCDKTRYCDATC